MNSIELRYEIFKALDANADVDQVDMVSPVPGEPNKLRVMIGDPYASGTRTYVISIEEQ